MIDLMPHHLLQGWEPGYDDCSAVLRRCDGSPQVQGWVSGPFDGVYSGTWYNEAAVYGELHYVTFTYGTLEEAIQAVQKALCRVA